MPRDFLNLQKRITNLPVIQPSSLALIFLTFLLFLSADEASQTRATVTAEAVSANCSFPVDKGWVEKVNHIRWVAYSSPHPDSNQRFYQPTVDTIYQDLKVLRKAQFTGLIIYGSAGIMGQQFPSIAQSLGFKGIIMGIWIRLIKELNNAQNAASLPIVLGYTIGNEALSSVRDRYSISTLCSAIADLRARTGKPVTTSEDVDTYDLRPALLSVGDWLFPIAHPYWHSTKDSREAIKWNRLNTAAWSIKPTVLFFSRRWGCQLPARMVYRNSIRMCFIAGWQRRMYDLSILKPLISPPKSTRPLSLTGKFFMQTMAPNY